MGKICTDQLVGKLADLLRLRDADPDKFDKAVEKAKKQLDAEAKRAHREDLEKLFDGQIRMLKDLGVNWHVVRALRNQKRSVIEKASGMVIGEGNIPFIPIIKPVHLGYYGLMSMVFNGRENGSTYLNPAAFTDKVKTPSGLYYIYDVEDGKSTLGRSTKAAEKIFKDQSRSPLTVAEVINLCVVKDVLSHHYVWAIGSRYESDDEVPIVYIDCNGQPMLIYGNVSESNSSWGFASCGSR